MLDTNMVSDLIRNPRGRARQHLQALGVESVCTSILVAAELRYGALKRGSLRLTADIEDALNILAVVSFETPAERIYAEIRDGLTKSGQPIGPVDYFIAAHALALDLTLVTANVGEFARVPGLRVENWLD